MKVGARNLIPGAVKKPNVGMVAAEVVIEVATGVEVVAVIGKESVEGMGPGVDMPVKAPGGMVVTD